MDLDESKLHPNLVLYRQEWNKNVKIFYLGWDTWELWNNNIKPVKLFYIWSLKTHTTIPEETFCSAFSDSWSPKFLGEIGKCVMWLLYLVEWPVPDLHLLYRSTSARGPTHKLYGTTQYNHHISSVVQNTNVIDLLTILQMSTIQLMEGEKVHITQSEINILWI